MKRVLRSLGFGAVVMPLVVSAAGAQQPWIFAGGGITIPVSTYGDYAKTGWLATGGVGVDLGETGWWVTAEGHFGRNDHEDFPGDRTDILAGFGVVGYQFARAQRVRPYVLAGAGFLSHKFNPAVGDSQTETKFGFTGAAGLGIRLGARASFWVEGRYMHASETRMIPVLAGFAINFGN